MMDLHINKDSRQWLMYHFSRSTYITVLWNWFMILAGKAAEPFLFASVLYAGYKLLPGVSLPPANVDAIMFMAQMAALDIGGMGLLKIAQQEKLGYHSLAYRVGFILIALMIANVVLATVEHVFVIPSEWASGIESCLLIARAVMCVVYGYAVHSLRDDPEGEQVNTPQSEHPDVNGERPEGEQGERVNTEHSTRQVNTDQLPASERLPACEYYGEWVVNGEQGEHLTGVNGEHVEGERVNAAFSLVEYEKVIAPPQTVDVAVVPAPPVDVPAVLCVAEMPVKTSQKPNRTRKVNAHARLSVVTDMTPEARVRRAYSEHGLSTSIRSIATMLNVSPATVKKWKDVIEHESERPVEQVNG